MYGSWPFRPALERAAGVSGGGTKGCVGGGEAGGGVNGPPGVVDVVVVVDVAVDAVVVGDVEVVPGGGVVVVDAVGATPDVAPVVVPGDVVADVVVVGAVVVATVVVVVGVEQLTGSVAGRGAARIGAWIRACAGRRRRAGSRLGGRREAVTGAEAGGLAARVGARMRARTGGIADLGGCRSRCSVTRSCCVSRAAEAGKRKRKECQYRRSSLHVVSVLLRFPEAPRPNHTSITRWSAVNLEGPPNATRIQWHAFRRLSGDTPCRTPGGNTDEIADCDCGGGSALRPRERRCDRTCRRWRPLRCHDGLVDDVPLHSRASMREPRLQGCGLRPPRLLHAHDDHRDDDDRLDVGLAVHACASVREPGLRRSGYGPLDCYNPTTTTETTTTDSTSESPCPRPSVPEPELRRGGLRARRLLHAGHVYDTKRDDSGRSGDSSGGCGT